MGGAEQPPRRLSLLKNPFRWGLYRSISVLAGVRYHAGMEFIIILIAVLVVAAAMGFLVESLGDRTEA
jgi:hypothetical protein